MINKFYLLLLSILLTFATGVCAKVRYGYLRNTSIYGSNMGYLETMLAPGAELLTKKINIQAIDYGFQGYIGDIILFLLSRPDTEIIVKTLDVDEHWKEGIDPKNGTVKILISQVDGEPTTITEYFSKRVGDAALSVSGIVSNITSISDVVFYGFDKLLGEEIALDALYDFTDKATDVFYLKEKMSELIKESLSKNKIMRKAYNKVINKKAIIIITNYVSPTKERTANSLINTHFTRITFSQLAALLYATKY